MLIMDNPPLTITEDESQPVAVELVPESIHKLLADNEDIPIEWN